MPTENRSGEMVSVPPHIGLEPLVGRYYPAKCRRCGWVGSSEELTGDDAQCTRDVGDRLCLGDCDELGPDDLLSIIQAMAKARQHQGEPVALPMRRSWSGIAGWKDQAEIKAWNACLDEIAKLGPLYARPAPEDTAEVEALKADKQAYAQNTMDLRAEVERLRNELGNALEEASAIRLQAGGIQMEIDELGQKLAKRDALLREQSGNLIVLAARLLQEPLRVLNGDLDSDGPITRIKVTDGVDRAGDSLGGLAIEVRRVADALSASAEPSVTLTSVPDGYCLMPKQLTAENGAKALLLGEFKLQVTRECPECLELEEPLEGCEICDGEGEYMQRHTIPWDQIKFIYSEAVKGLAIKPTDTLDRKPA